MTPDPAATNEDAWLTAMVVYTFLSAGTMVYITKEIFAGVLIVPSLVFSYGVYSLVMWRKELSARRKE